MGGSSTRPPQPAHKSVHCVSSPSRYASIKEGPLKAVPEFWSNLGSIFWYTLTIIIFVS